MAGSPPSKLTRSKEHIRTFFTERITAGQALLPKLQGLSLLAQRRDVTDAVAAWHSKNARALERFFTQQAECLQYRNTQVPPDESGTLGTFSGYRLMELRLRHLEHLLDSLDLYDVAEPPPPPPPRILDSLHPEIQKRCRALFENRHYSEAILSAFKVVEDTIRTKIGAKPEEVGKELISRAMKKKAPLIVLSKVEPEQESAHLLFMGAIGFFRNPEAHRFTDINDPVKALETISFASILMRLLDEAKVRIPVAQETKPKVDARRTPNKEPTPAPVPSEILDSLGRLLANVHEASTRVLVDVRSNLTALQITCDEFERRFRQNEHHFDSETRKLVSDCIVCLNGVVGYFRLSLEHPNATAGTYEGTADWRAREKLMEFTKLHEEIISRFHQSRGAPPPVPR